jgi:hypothetical protein
MKRLNEIDYHYYSNLRDIFSPQYDWENLILTAGASEEDLDFSIGIEKRNPEQIKILQQFIHEYIHFLQNFCTTWGAGIYSDLFIAYSKISVSILNGEEKFLPPLNNQKIGNEMFDDGVIMRLKTLERLTKNDRYSYELKNELTIINYHYEGEKVVFKNGICEYMIGIKGIREHMANLGSFLMLGYSEKEIHESNISCTEFIDGDQRLYKHPEYWIMFEYFFETYPNIKDLGKGMYFLFNECLTRANPDQALYRFFQYFTTNPDRYLLNTNFFQFLIEWMKQPQEIVSFQASQKLTIENLEQRLSYINKNLDHDLPRAAKLIVEMIKENIIKGEGGRKIFPKDFIFSELKYWYELIQKYGSSIVSFNQEMKMVGNDKMLEPFKIMNCVTLAFKEANKNSPEFSCPFFVDIPICNAKEKNAKICDGNPYEMLKTQTEKDCCNLMAGIFLLGLDKRIT